MLLAAFKYSGYYEHVVEYDKCPEEVEKGLQESSIVQ